MHPSCQSFKNIAKWIVFSLFLPVIAGAAELRDNDPWGIAIGFRSGKIPYATDEDRVSDVLPLLYFDNEYVFVKGRQAGIKLFTDDAIQLNLLSRYRFFDIPSDYQNQIRGDGLDFGLQTIFAAKDNLETSFELMSDDEGRYYSSIGARYYANTGGWKVTPYANLRVKSTDFNNRYFGLDGFEYSDRPGVTFKNDIGSGWDMTIGAEIRYHLFKNLHFLGRAQVTTLLDDSTRSSVALDDETYGEVFLGIAFFDDPTVSRPVQLVAEPYWRLAHGFATPSSMGDILLRWDVEDDPQNNRLTSVFYGHPVSDSLFGFEQLDVYVTTGFIYHHGSDPYTHPDSGITYDSQPTSEYVLAMKLYWNLNRPFKWRIGAAEGVSYVKDVTNIEQRSMDRKGYRGSNVMNFIDISLDVNIGDIFHKPSMEKVWFGYSLHHRSSIFETSSAFGRIKGGSNYNTLYLQYHF